MEDEQAQLLLDDLALIKDSICGSTGTPPQNVIMNAKTAQLMASQALRYSLNDSPPAHASIYGMAVLLCDLVPDGQFFVGTVDFTQMVPSGSLVKRG